MTSDKPKEECGIFGLYNKDDIDTAKIMYYGLYSLQHRGQESCGIVSSEGYEIHSHKGLGLTNEVFDELTLPPLGGGMAVGHVRYSTTGGNTIENAQPLVTKYSKGTLTIAHNGNISNAAKLRSQLEKDGAIFQTTNDTEIIAFLIARARQHTPSVEQAVSEVIKKLEGAFSLLVMSPRKLIAVRDPYGIRPLCIGKIKNSYLFSSESCALDAVGAAYLRDVEPGEIVIATGDDALQSRKEHCGKRPALCIFEHIYFARPDSVIDHQSVYEARIEAGRALARESKVEADLVIGVPDSGIIAALGYARESKIPFGEGLVKNRFVGRTFIQPAQNQRQESVHIKLNVLASNVVGKRIVMIDDSIVRGTTITNIVKMLRKAGAREVHVRISSPPFLWPCFFGTDISNREQLAANQFSMEELRSRIQADSLAFLTIESLKGIAKHSKVTFCDACFTGNYPFPVPIHADKSAFEDK